MNDWKQKRGCGIEEKDCGQNTAWKCDMKNKDAREVKGQNHAGPWEMHQQIRDSPCPQGEPGQDTA